MWATNQEMFGDIQREDFPFTSFLSHFLLRLEGGETGKKS